MTAVVAFVVLAVTSRLKLGAPHCLFLIIAPVRARDRHPVAHQPDRRRRSALGLFFVYAAALGMTVGVIVAVHGRVGRHGVPRRSAMFGGGGALRRHDQAHRSRSIGGFLFMGMIGLIVAIVVNVFLGSSAIGYFISSIGVVIFTASPPTTSSGSATATTRRRSARWRRRPSSARSTSTSTSSTSSCSCSGSSAAAARVRARGLEPRNIRQVDPTGVTERLSRLGRGQTSAMRAQGTLGSARLRVLRASPCASRIDLANTPTDRRAASPPGVAPQATIRPRSSSVAGSVLARCFRGPIGAQAARPRGLGQGPWSDRHHRPARAHAQPATSSSPTEPSTASANGARSSRDPRHGARPRPGPPRPPPHRQVGRRVADHRRPRRRHPVA